MNLCPITREACVGVVFPPFALYVIVYSTAVQIAFRVMLVGGVYGLVRAGALPVNDQPVNVKPALDIVPTPGKVIGPRLGR